MSTTLYQPLKILQVHTHYRESGGEDRVVNEEYDLLSKYHQVSQFIRFNNHLELMDRPKQFKVTLWNSEIYRDFLTTIRHERPDLIHVHNTFPLMSPGIYHAASSLRIPVVHTLHNYRLVCIGSELYRDGKICEDCLGKLPFSGMIHRCYRNSYAASSAVGSMLMLHGVLGTWQQKIDSYICLSDTSKNIFVRAGLDAKRIYVKPNFVSGPTSLVPKEQPYALFVGRLIKAKGINTLLEAWTMGDLKLPLNIIGSGPLEDYVRHVSQTSSNIQYLGPQLPSTVLELMQQAFVLVFPSVWLEPFGLTIIEAFACGLPVVASNLGAASELVTHGQTGLHFTPGSSDDLISKINWLAQNPALAANMGRKAHNEYLEKYTPDANYAQLMKIYAHTLERAKYQLS